jgi:hypothetical protein
MHCSRTLQPPFYLVLDTPRLRASERCWSGTVGCRDPSDIVPPPRRRLTPDPSSSRTHGAARLTGGGRCITSRPTNFRRGTGRTKTGSSRPRGRARATYAARPSAHGSGARDRDRCTPQADPGTLSSPLDHNHLERVWRAVREPPRRPCRQPRGDHPGVARGTDAGRGRDEGPPAGAIAAKKEPSTSDFV